MCVCVRVCQIFSFSNPDRLWTTWDNKLTIFMQIDTQSEIL